MPRPASKDAKSRLNLEIPERVRERLVRVQDLSGATSITEAIIRSLSVYDALLTTVRETGAKVVVRNPDGTEQELFLL
jgi:hypothetical protein